MNYNLERQLKEIVARSYPSDEVERQMMEKIFARLAQHQSAFLSELGARIDAEGDNYEWDKDFDVAVKLVSRGDVEGMRGFEPLNVGDAFFLDAAYDEIPALCNETYEGTLTDPSGVRKKFSYRLRRHFRFVRREKILFDVASRYHIKRPVIFSPYARKAVEIIPIDLGNEELKNCTAIDFKNDKLIVDRELVWNVQIKSAMNNREPVMGADGNLIRYEYEYQFDDEAKVFVMTDRHFDDFYRVRDENGKKIVLRFNALLDAREYQTVRLNEIEDLRGAFCNDFPRRNDRLRLRTKGDVENVLACFNATRMGQEFPASYQSGGGGKVINVYRREDGYYISDEEQFLAAIKRKPVCNIKFDGDARSIFKADYVSYVVDYMTRNYPEFGWAGVGA